jgi:hypothetical protein
MAISRYARAPVLELGKRFGTSNAIPTIRAGIENGTISYIESVYTAGTRLDILAADYYGDGRYWWIIAAASNIGWAPQVPPGTYLRIPKLEDVLNSVG